MPMKIITTALMLLLSSLAVASPKLYVFDCGAIYLADVTMFNLQSNETPVRELFVPCYLIEHGNERLLWDTGLPLNAAGKGRIALDDGGDYDVFGDGSVKLVYAPGHTPGHQTLLINLPKTGLVMLSGDLYHFRESRPLRRVPKFNYDAAMSLQSIDKVEALLKTTGATLWIEHDKAFADTLQKAPQFYE